MKIPEAPNQKIRGHLTTVLVSFGLVMFYISSAQALNLNVLDADGNPIGATGYRWLVEEDKTYHVQLNPDGTVETASDPNNGGIVGPVLDPTWRVGPDGVLGGGDDDPLRNTLSVSFHRSYMPIVAKGTQADIDAFTPEAGKYYFISILPDSGYSMGGASFKGDAATVTAYVGNSPIPHAQISIFMHQDIAPINGVWDVGEPPLEGFGIVLEDAGGKYGASAGIQSTDVYGNPLCTAYVSDGAGGYLPDPADPDMPLIDGVGTCVTDADGRLIIKNLAPAKYGVIAIQPPGSTWVQTSTIEGTRLIDAWVKGNEPEFFGEFGPPGPHVNIGFAPANATTPYVDSTALTGGATISGRIVNLHLSRPPNGTFNTGGPFPHTTPYVGLNDASGGVLGNGLFAAITDGGSFTIPNVPDGEYQLVAWDDNLDIVFAKNTVNIVGGNCNALTGCDLGDVGVFQWFTRLENYVYGDIDGDFTFDDGEGIPEQNVNLRWRDGTIYQAFATDFEGFVPFDQVFPFFSWLVAEVDFARFKATGVTITVDDGGPIPFGSDWSFGDNLTPQIQNNPSDPDSDLFIDDGTGALVARHESGAVLSQGFQGFLGQTSMLQWSKENYGPEENGGISGVVMYAVTRAEDDPELAAAEPWEPGIPGVTVNLWASDGDGNVVGGVPLATTTSDSWDDSIPTNCQYGANAGTGTGDDPYVFRGVDTDCYDGLRNWNQVRPAVFDGGYAFGPEYSIADDFGGVAPGWITVPDGTKPDVGYIVAGSYIVEVIPPAGYEIIKSQDRNVDFGDEYTPSPLLLPAPCVGADYVVPAQLTLFPGVDAPLAGQTLQTCDRKEVVLNSFSNAAADFSLFTEVPISGHLIGFILDDTANEFDPASPQFGEKYAPPFLPVSIRDWTGREISRTVSDENGVYNALVPSTFTTNLPAPSGMGPNMLTTCMNSKIRPDGTPDPLHNSQYSQFCYTFQYMPGSTTYLDTPVVPVAAFAGPDQNPLDCELPTTTPRISSVSVNNGVGGGPYIPARTTGVVQGNRTITIESVRSIEVPNPAYDGPDGSEPKTITRSYGFSQTQGSGSVTIGGLPVPVISWGGARIKVRVPNLFDFGSIGAKQLIVTNDNGKSTVTGVSVQVGLRPYSNVVTVPGDYTTIQAAIDAAGINDLILVGPGNYDEIVIMWKPVQLQGWGEGSTSINAVKTPFEKLTAWRALAENLLATNSIDLIAGQELGFAGIEPDTFFSEEGAGVFVVGKRVGGNKFERGMNQGARIDGFTISGADTGGGVTVNGYANYLEISNLKITNNSALYAGGIRVGHPFVSFEDVHTDADNNFVRIHHNTVVQNGGLDGAGGGIALHTGSDSYEVSNNYVCGNFTMADGAGIAHLGLSDNGLITENTVIFNENFNQGAPTNGGGILVAGKLPTIIGDPSPGSGSVEIIGNLIQGNAAGAGDGGGIQLSRVNGADVSVDGENNVLSSYSVDVINNIIVNNEAALAGGGISLQDALDVAILNNTIAQNDNASTAGAAFSPGVPSQSNPQPGAGVVSHAHLGLNLPPTAIDPGFSNPVMENNIVWQNRMFYWLLDETDPNDVRTGLCPDIGNTMLAPSCGTTPVFDDLAVIGTGNLADDLTCTDCWESGAADPLFVAGTFNGNRETTTFLPEVNTSIGAAPALDEGGNFIRLRYGPLTQTRDYHVQAASPVIDAGSDSGITSDFDLETRPNGGFDIGADEVYP